MTINATAGAKVYIGPASATIASLPEFEAITDADEWVQIGEVEDLGEWGPEGTEITFKSLEDSHVRRRKGTIDSGQVALICARDPLDAGQIAARAAVNDHLPRAFRVQLDDAPTPTGTPSEFYFRAIVLSARNNYSTADEITRTTFNLGIDGAVIEVEAEPVVVMSPAAGALTAGTEDVAYSGATISASGGIGTVTFAVTTGSLPAGLTLNASTGTITGTPTAAGTVNFTVTATCSEAGEGEAAYSIIIAP